MKKINTYEAIKKDIIKGFYKPGEYLEEKNLAERYGVSRTPIRESFGILKKEGLIENNLKKGVCASYITLKQIKDIFQLRYELEPMILNFSFHFISNSVMEKIKVKIFKALSEENLEELSQLDDILHDEILNSCKNNLAISMMQKIQDHTKRMRNLTYQDRKETLKSGREHLEIIEKILDKDLEGALKNLKKHIDSNQLYFVRNIDISN